MPHTCAFGCKETNVTVHCFPNPEKFPERFKIWVSLVGGKLETASDYELFKNKRICDIHFIAHRNRYKRLNNLAVPTLHLPELPGSQQPLDNQFNSATEVPTANSGLSSTSLKDISNIAAPFTNADPLEAPITQLSKVASENQADTVSDTISHQDALRNDLEMLINKIPIVYTTKLDDMWIFQRNLKNISKRDLVNIILCESLPVFNSLPNLKSEEKDISNFNDLKSKLSKLFHINIKRSPLKSKNSKLERSKQSCSNSKETSSETKPDSESQLDLNNESESSKNITVIIIDCYGKQTVSTLRDLGHELKEIEIIIYDRTFNEHDVYVLDTDGCISEYHRLIENDVKLNRNDCNKKQVFMDFCCWVQRNKCVTSMYPQYVSLPTLKFMLKPHNCLPNRCLCCCREDDVDEIKTSDAASVISESKDVITQDVDSYFLHKDWLAELNSDEKSSSKLIDRALCYNGKFTIKTNIESQTIVRYNSERHNKKVRFMKNEKEHKIIYEFNSNDGSLASSAMHPKPLYLQQIKQYRMYSGCCWYDYNRLKIDLLSEELNNVAKFCPIDDCACCCKNICKSKKRKITNSIPRKKCYDTNFKPHKIKPKENTKLKARQKIKRSSQKKTTQKNEPMDIQEHSEDDSQHQATEPENDLTDIMQPQVAFECEIGETNDIQNIILNIQEPENDLLVSEDNAAGPTILNFKLDEAERTSNVVYRLPMDTNNITYAIQQPSTKPVLIPLKNIAHKENQDCQIVLPRIEKTYSMQSVDDVLLYSNSNYTNWNVSTCESSQFITVTSNDCLEVDIVKSAPKRKSDVQQNVPSKIRVVSPSKLSVDFGTNKKESNESRVHRHYCKQNILTIDKIHNAVKVTSEPIKTRKKIGEAPKYVNILPKPSKLAPKKSGSDTSASSPKPLNFAKANNGSEPPTSSSKLFKMPRFKKGIKVVLMNPNDCLVTATVNTNDIIIETANCNGIELEELSNMQICDIGTTQSATLNNIGDEVTTSELETLYSCDAPQQLSTVNMNSDMSNKVTAPKLTTVKTCDVAQLSRVSSNNESVNTANSILPNKEMFMTMNKTTVKRLKKPIILKSRNRGFVRYQQSLSQQKT